MKTRGISVLTAIICIIATMLMVCGPAAAESAGDFYRGKNVTILIPSNPGGTLDSLTRLAATYLPEVTGANWGVVNQPAGGGLVCNNSYYTSKPDGLTVLANSLGKLWPGWLLNEPEIKYDITKFIYIGGTKGGQLVLGMKANGPYTSLDALKAGKGIKFASRHPTSLLNLGTLLCIEALNLDASVVAGYEGTPQIMFSILQDEVHGTVISGEGMYMAEQRKQLKGLVQIGDQRDEEYPDWPCLAEVTELSDRQKKMMGAIFPDGKAYMVAPGTPADRVKFLEEAFAAAWSNKGFQRTAKKMIGAWPGTWTGAQVKKMATGLASAKGEMPHYNELIDKYVK